MSIEFGDEDAERNVEVSYDPKKMVNAYFHGDLNLHKFFIYLGKDVVEKILKEI